MKKLLIYLCLLVSGFTWGQGNNHAAYFNGSSFLSVTQQPRLQTFTFSAWIKQDAVAKNISGEGGTIFSWGTSGDDAGVMALDTRFSKLTWGIWDRSANTYDYTQYQTALTGSWMHVALTGNSNDYVLYLNGREVSRKTIALNPTIAMFTIGANKSGNHIVRYFQGEIDEVALFNRVLSTNEIQQLMTQAPDYQNESLVLYLPYANPWRPWTDVSSQHHALTNNKAVVNATTPVSNNYTTSTLPAMTFESYALTTGESTTASGNETDVRLATGEIRFQGISNGCVLNDLSLRINHGKEYIKNLSVFLATEKDNYATQTLLTQVNTTALSGNQINIPLKDTLVYGNVKLSFSVDMNAGLQANDSVSISTPSLTINQQTQVAATNSIKVTTNENLVNKPTENKTGLVRNPAMGWVLYLDAFGQMKSTSQAPDYNKGVFYPEDFWKAFDDCGATDVATIFYMRAPWSFYEPTKGNYAWNDPNSNFSKLVNGALQRGLQLAFRVYVDSKDSYTQATPQYVKDDGAQGVIKDFWTPYATDPVFLRSLRTFINAFGAQYNDPMKVAYIDAMGLGNWGEGHNVPLNNGGTLNQALDSISKYYRAAFPDVLLGGQEGGSMAWYAKDLVDGKKAVRYDIRRRDSFGMTSYLSQNDRTDYANYVATKQIPLMAENGWNYFGHRAEDNVFRAYTQSAGSNFPNVRTMMEYTMNTDVIPSRANTFDLRVPEDAIQWMKNKDLVDKFMIEGGYRFVPTRVEYSPVNKFAVFVGFDVKNTGIGILPNKTPAYKNRFKLAFALIDKQTNEVAKVSIHNSNPGDWLKEGGIYSYRFYMPITGVALGTYTLGYAIVDTQNNNQPAIKFAIENAQQINGWYVAGDVDIVSNDPTTGISTPKSTKKKDNNVYTLDGKLVQKIKSEAELSELPKGVYIVNGTKIIK